MHFRADYGFDAPGVARNLLAIGTAVGASGLAIARSERTVARPLGFATSLTGAIAFGLGASMVAYRLGGKRRMRDRMLHEIDRRRTTDVLDVGTGAGFLAVGAATLLPAGRIVGIDVWSTADLSNNAYERTLANVRGEGVLDRVAIRTGDARALDFADASFDAVVSLLCLHNVEDEAERVTACREIARVLRPGGRAVIADYVPTTTYASTFAEAGLNVASSRTTFATALTMMWMVVADKPLDD